MCWVESVVFRAVEEVSVSRILSMREVWVCCPFLSSLCERAIALSRWVMLLTLVRTVLVRP